MPGEKYVMLSIIAMSFAGGWPRFPMFPEVPWADSVPLLNDTLPSRWMPFRSPSPLFV